MAGGRHSFTLGSFGRARGDFSGVISVAGSSGCEASEDNELVLCADAVTLVTPSGTVDLAKLARRALTTTTNDDDDDDDEHQDTHSTIDPTRNRSHPLAPNGFPPAQGGASLQDLDELRQDVLALRRRVAELEGGAGISSFTTRKQSQAIHKSWQGWLSSTFFT